MKNKLLRSITLILGVLSTTSFAVNIPMHSISKDLEYLASDQLKGRKVFTPEIDEAANYISNRFKQMGLKTFKSSYLQNFAIFNITPSTPLVTLNGVEIPLEKIAIASTARSFSWDENSEITKHVIGEQDDLRKSLSELNLQGGNHLVVIHHQHQDLFKRYKMYFEHGLTKLDDSNSGTIALVLNNSKNIRSFNVNGGSTLTKKHLKNVIGVLPGKSLEHEVVLFSAHYDHIGTKLTKGQDEITEDVIYNGADDNASGVTGMLSLAQHYARQKNNKRTLIFVAFTGEEVGGFGSKYFSQHLPPENVIAMINMEMIGKESKFGSGRLWMTGMERSNLATIMNKALRGKAFPIEKDPYPKQQLFYRSDNATLARLGVPAHSFSTVQLEGDEHYHAVTDEFSTIKLSSLKQVIETIALGAQPLVLGKATPSRVDTSKVKPDGKIY